MFRLRRAAPWGAASAQSAVCGADAGEALPLTDAVLLIG
jgi:hypothetical protein